MLQTLGPFTAYSVIFVIVTLLHVIDRLHHIYDPAPSLALEIVHRAAGPCNGMYVEIKGSHLSKYQQINVGLIYNNILCVVWATL